MQDQVINTAQKRLRILGDDEIEALYGRPHFTDDERLEYFALSPTEKATLEQLHSIKSRIYFILQLGYFKSHHMFFVFDLPDVEEDARFIQRQYLALWYFPECKNNVLSTGYVNLSMLQPSERRVQRCARPLRFHSTSPM